MDDYSVTSLYESKNEWASRLVNILTPLIQEGIRSIFDEAVKLCVGNKEQDKYLMTFQNLLLESSEMEPEYYQGRDSSNQGAKHMRIFRGFDYMRPYYSFEVYDGHACW